MTARYFTIGTTTWNDLQPYGSGFILAGMGGAIAQYDIFDGGVTMVGGGSCAGHDFYGVSVRPVDQAVFLSTGTGSLVRWTGPMQCSGVNALTTGIGTAIKAYDDAIFVGSFDSMSVNSAGVATVTRVRPDGGAPSSQQLSGAGQIWELSGPSPAFAFAAGWDHATQLRNRVWAYDSSNLSWSAVVASNNANSQLYAIDVPTPTLGFAAGEAFFQWDGAVWTARPAPPFSVYGLKVFSATEVYAAGADSNGRAPLALWNGNVWALMNAAMRPLGTINRLRGTSRCGLLGVGSGGKAVTTLP